MKHSFIDKYSDIDSPVHRTDPGIKLLCVLTAILCMVSEHRLNLSSFVIYGIILMIIIGLSRLPLIYILIRLFLVLPVIFLAAAFYPLSELITEGSGNFRIDNPSVIIAVSIFLKAILSVLFLILLVSTEKFHNLLAGLRKVKMPAVIYIIAALMYRYVFILADESMKTSLARQSRTPGTLRMNKWKVLGNQMSVVFLRSWERSKTIYSAMCSRGFSGNFHSMNQRHIKALDIVIFCIFGILFLSVRFRNEIGVIFSQSMYH